MVARLLGARVSAANTVLITKEAGVSWIAGERLVPAESISSQRCALPYAAVGRGGL